MGPFDALTSRYWPLGRSFGRVGLVGVIALLASIGVHVVHVEPARARADAWRQQLLSDQPSLSPALAEQRRFVESASARLRGFETRLPTVGQLADVLERLHRIADRHGLVWKVGEYRLHPSEPRMPYARYEVNVPLTGTYTQLRTFVGESLRELPGAALEGLTIRRETISRPQSDAVLKLVVFLREAE